MTTRTNSNYPNDFWSNIPLISSAVIILLVLNYILYFLDIDRNADNSFTQLINPNLNDIRSGSYWGLITSSLLEDNFIFLVWGIGWIFYFGVQIENNIRFFSYLFLILSSLIVPELFGILISQSIGYGIGGVVTSLCGLLWFYSEFAQSEWYFSSFEKIHFILFIFICILVTFTGIYPMGIAGLIGGFMWGIFLGFITTFRSIIVRILVPILVFCILLVPVFWAPWQPSWLVHQAQKYERLNEIERAKEIYRKALAKDKDYSPAINGLTDVLYKEFEQYFDQEEYDKAKVPLLQTLEIDPANETTKKNLQLTSVSKLRKESLEYHNQGVTNQDKKEFKEAEKLYKEAEKLYLEILSIEPNNEFAKENLQIIKKNLKNLQNK